MGKDIATGEYVSFETMQTNRDRYKRVVVYTDERLNALWRMIYEPEHEKTTCWCNPRFVKRPDGKLEIVHNEQKDVITDHVATLLKP